MNQTYQERLAIKQAEAKKKAAEAMIKKEQKRLAGLEAKRLKDIALAERRQKELMAKEAKRIINAQKVEIKKSEEAQRYALKKAEIEQKQYEKNKEYALKKGLPVSPAPTYTTKNDPQKSISQERFEDKIIPYKAGSNGFYVSQNKVDDRYDDEYETFVDDNFDLIRDGFEDEMDGLPKTMGFDLFGINVNTDALLNKATTLAQTEVNKYLNPPITQAPAPIVVAPPTTITETNYVNSPMGIDPALMKNLILGGKIFGGLVGTLLAIKITMAVMPSFKKN